MKFEWNEKKNIINKRKHGVSFEEAKTVLFDPNALTVEDIGNYGEIRYKTLGMDFLRRVLVLVWTERTPNIRIISAWKANSKQREQYERQ